MDKATHIMIRFVIIFFAVCLFIYSPFLVKITDAGKKSIIMENGWVSIHSEDQNILSLLEEMVHELDIELFLVITPENKQVTLNVKKISVPEAISRVLNGYDYAVVYPNPKENRNSQHLVMVSIPSNAETMNIPIDDPIVNFDENFWQTFTPHKYLGGYNIIFMPFSYSTQKERPKELTVEAFIKAYEDRIKMIQEELSEEYADKEFTRWVIARAKAELEFYKEQLEGIEEE